MGRYTGPKHKLARREGVNILDKSNNSLMRRLNVPPGVHGRKGKRRPSEYGTQLREKQKAKAIYGMYEKQFKNMISALENKKGDTSELLIALLETRLDNLVYRLGYADTRYQARQFVSHGHVRVDDKKISIPSYQVKVGEKIALSPKMQRVYLSVKEKDDKEDETLPFIKKKGILGTLSRMPKREDIEVPFNIQSIIEYYSR